MGCAAKSTTRLLPALVDEVKMIADRTHLSSHHLQSIEAALTDLRRRLNRIEALSETLPKS